MLFLFATVGFAQQVACDPAPVTSLVASLDALEPTLADDVAASERALDAAAEVARCLEVPIPRPLLARLAWARAEHASLRQDEVAVWSWARLAVDSGSDQPPERVGPTHPLRRVLDEAPEAPGEGGPDEVHLVAPKKGAVYVDGQVVTAPRVRLETPHLVQVFERDVHYLGAWQVGADFPRALLVPRESARARPTADAHDSVPPPNWKPAKRHTEDAYREWIDKHPDGPWVQEAKDAIDELRWEAALQASDLDLALRQYVHDFPDGLHLRDARFRIEHARYEKVMDAPNRSRWVEFLQAFPEGSYAAEARQQIQTIDWREAQREHTPAAYARFLERHPQGVYSDRAHELEERLSFDRAAAVLSETGLQRYLERWPEGRFHREARAMLGGVQMQAITVAIDGDLAGGDGEPVRTALLHELEERRLPVAEQPGADTASLAVKTALDASGTFPRVQAWVELRWADLQRPLATLQIDSPIPPGDDARARLGELLAGALMPFDRWWTPPPQDEPPAPPDAP